MTKQPNFRTPTARTIRNYDTVVELPPTSPLRERKTSEGSRRIASEACRCRACGTSAVCGPAEARSFARTSRVVIRRQSQPSCACFGPHGALLWSGCRQSQSKPSLGLEKQVCGPLHWKCCRFLRPLRSRRCEAKEVLSMHHCTILWCRMPEGSVEGIPQEKLRKGDS